MSVNSAEMFDFLKQSDITVEELRRIITDLERLEVSDIEKKRLEIAEQREEKNLVPIDYKVIELHKKCTENKGVLTCPHCGSIAVVKNGTKDGRQRYLCKDCRRTHGDTQNTIFYRSRFGYEDWETFVAYTLENKSLPYIQKNHGLAVSDGWFHRHQLLSLLMQSQEEQDTFQHIAQADEYYTPLSFKGIRDKAFFIENLHRMPRHYKKKVDREAYLNEVGYDLATAEQLDGYSKKDNFVFSRAKNEAIELNGLNSVECRKRGISNEQVCVLTCIDKAGNVYISPTCVGPVTAKYIKHHFDQRLAPDSILVTDSHIGYRKYAEEAHISLRQIPPGRHSIGPHNLNRVNGFHSRLDTFEGYYRQVASKYLDHYLALYRWQDQHRHLPLKEQSALVMDLITSNFGHIGETELKSRDYPFDTKKLKLPKYREEK